MRACLSKRRGVSGYAHFVLRGCVRYLNASKRAYLSVRAVPVLAAVFSARSPRSLRGAIGYGVFESRIRTPREQKLA